MAGSRRARAKPLDSVPEGLVERVAETVRARGAVPIRELAPVALSRTALATLVDELGRRGLERTGRFVRVPIAEQLEALLAVGVVPLQPAASLKRLLPGAGAAAELKHIVTTLVRSGRGAVAVRDGREHLARPSVALLDSRELDRLAEIAAAMAKLVKSARPKRGGLARTLFREDVANAIEAARSIGGATQADAVEALVDAVQALETPAMPLVPVPAIAHALGERLAPAALRDALLQAAREGRLELRPESGVGTLTPADASLCPRSAAGDLLTYVRRVPG